MVIGTIRHHLIVPKPNHATRTRTSDSFYDEREVQFLGMYVNLIVML